MKIFVTGAGGFIGRVVVRRLAAKGHDIAAHVGPPGTELEAPPEASSSVTFAIEDARDFAGRLSNHDVVVHLAGPAAVAGSFAAPLDYVRAHAVGTSAIVAAARAAGVPRLIYVSSAEVYGRRSEARVHEGMLPQPRSPYAAAKVAGEAIVGAAARTGGPTAVVLRPFSVYGPGQRPSSLLATIVDRAKSGRRVELRDLAPVRDYCQVDDVAEAIACACRCDIDECNVFNVGTGVGTSVADLAAMVTHVLGACTSVAEIGADRGPAEIFRLVADTSHARAGLGWRADVGLREGIEGLLSACPA